MSSAGSAFIGVDGAGSGWVCFVAVPSKAPLVLQVPSLKVLDEALEARQVVPAVIAVDIPLRLPEDRQRRADQVALRFRRYKWAQRQRSENRVAGTIRSPFLSPPLAAIRHYVKAPKKEREDKYQEWRKMNNYQGRGWDDAAWGKGMADQVMEAEKWLASRGTEKMGTVIEYFPEFSFTCMSGIAPLSKREWNGGQERQTLLKAFFVSPAEIRVEGYNVKPSARPDDVLDAAVGAWTAQRYAQNEARSCLRSPEDNCRDGVTAIWA